MATIYPYLPDPTAHPDYERRHARVPTWETFGNTTQFISLRGFTMEDGRLVGFRETLDDYVDRFGLGRIIWPQFPTLFAENLDELVAELKRRDSLSVRYLGACPRLGQSRYVGARHHAGKGMIEKLEAALGDRFLGIDNGEQDGRYIGQYAQQQCPWEEDPPGALPQLSSATSSAWETNWATG